MALGPIEVLVIGFPGNQFNGEILPELESLIERGIVSVVDGMLIHKDDDGVVDVIEFEDVTLEGPLKALQGLASETVLDIVSDSDVDEFALALDPGSSAAVLVFEHTWAKPFRDAVVGSGGFLVANLRIPGAVIDEVLSSVDA